MNESESTVCVVQHVPCETPGLLADVLHAHGVSLRYVCPFRGERIPRRLGRHAGLILMGGPMGVYEQDRHPFLRHEIRLLEDTLSENRPILGICLGSQLLAAALGAPVTRGECKEIGWYPVTLSRAAATDSLWRGLPATFTAFHWHGDVFGLPAGATNLAWSKLTDCQAFRYGESAYGLLFHLEVTEGNIQRMARVFRSELLNSGVHVPRLLASVPEHLLLLQETGRVVFERWIQLLNDRERPRRNPGKHTAKTTAATDVGNTAGEEPREASSPPCYLSEFVAPDPRDPSAA